MSWRFFGGLFFSLIGRAGPAPSLRRPGLRGRGELQCGAEAAAEPRAGSAEALQDPRAGRGHCRRRRRHRRPHPEDHPGGVQVLHHAHHRPPPEHHHRLRPRPRPQRRQGGVLSCLGILIGLNDRSAPTIVTDLPAENPFVPGAGVRLAGGSPVQRGERLLEDGPEHRTRQRPVPEGTAVSHMIKSLHALCSAIIDWSFHPQAPAPAPPSMHCLLN